MYWDINEDTKSRKLCAYIERGVGETGVSICHCIFILHHRPMDQTATAMAGGLQLEEIKTSAEEVS
jgi:hypothetical protein